MLSPSKKTCVLMLPVSMPSVVNWAMRTRKSGPAIPLDALGKTNHPPPVRSEMAKLLPFDPSAGSNTETHEFDPDSRMEISDSPDEGEADSAIPMVTKLSNSLEG